MNMNCKKAEEYLVDYLYQELPAKKTLEIEKHLRGCTHCSNTLESWRTIHRAYQRTTEEPQIATYTKQKILAFAEEELRRTPGWSEKLLWVIKLATVPVAIFVIVLFLNAKKEPSSDMAMRRNEPQPPASIVQPQSKAEVAKPQQAITGGRKVDLYDSNKQVELKRKAANYADPSSPAPATEAPKKEMDQETEEKLRSLGYVSGSDAPAENRSMPAASPAPPPATAEETATSDYRQRTDELSAKKTGIISKVSKDAPEVPLRKAQQQFEQNNVVEGQKLLNEATASDDGKELADKLYQEGNAFQTRGELGKAIPYYEQVQTNYKNYTRMDEVLLRLGDSYAEVGQFDKAVQTYNQVSPSQQKIARERISRLQKKQEAQKQLETLGYVDKE